ncbi:SigE family RNA polymerase sigma factor [Streptosporangium roseum]|uniref:RNA polymerase, sigma-24 subunit, ECF subfamily n=1 Tax=Streptosporangium roseum (strain ATCC 12428 / DSM 43021 / JCM 3005 / KCTC 9067 / NCIMB 10171 / NRRL 2505 / NI 9100) TaxID=479432 RepID=D2B3X4_STRRD|nr:SigE family RNA polymerase sigma factor [Streptosporangium roseum]ACZ89409.1 RNA polymerase, sigma-24 subunit, ECF subfamily [Streptosporangium roseum DSM 43021]
MRDRADFERYVEQRSARLLRTAYLLCRDWGTAEDLLQTALAKAWSVWRRVGDDPDPYVYRILTNTHASWWRRRWRAEVPTGVLPDVAGEDMTGEIGTREAVRQALAGLPDRQRAVIVLRYFADLPDPRIAEILGCSVATVRSQASRALAKLRVDPATVAAITTGS